MNRVKSARTSISSCAESESKGIDSFESFEFLVCFLRVQTNQKNVVWGVFRAGNILVKYTDGEKVKWILHDNLKN